MPKPPRWEYLSDAQVMDLMADEAPSMDADVAEHAAFMLACAKLAPRESDRSLLVILAATLAASAGSDAESVADAAEHHIQTIRDALAVADLLASLAQ
jgi:hypothetical protein